MLVHALTVKGKGYAPAEENPGEFHGVGSFDIDKVPDPDVAPKDSFSTIFGKKLSQMADTNDKICGITAAMKYGTGLQFMYRNHRERFLMWVWRKSTPLHFPPLWQNLIWNRLCACTPHLAKWAMDQYINDVMLLNLNVMFGIDRAGASARRR